MSDRQRAARRRSDHPRERTNERSHRNGNPSAALQRRIERLEARLAEESMLRQSLESDLAHLRSAPPPEAPASADPQPHDDPERSAPARPRDEIDYSKSALERGLIAAGIDPQRAAALKRHDDELTMAEMYLRDQATREDWLDSPRYREEMEALAAERTALRDEIGDQAYDRFLFAQGRNNRVRVDDVLGGSAASDAGLQAGDMIVRYGDARIFAPHELVAETHAGRAGETVQLEIVRQGEALSLEILRGPLGIRVAATQDDPERIDLDGGE